MRKLEEIKEEVKMDKKGIFFNQKSIDNGLIKEIKEMYHKNRTLINKGRVVVASALIPKEDDDKKEVVFVVPVDDLETWWEYVEESRDYLHFLNGKIEVGNSSLVGTWLTEPVL